MSECISCGGTSGISTCDSCGDTVCECCSCSCCDCGITLCPECTESKRGNYYCEDCIEDVGDAEDDEDTD